MKPATKLFFLLFATISLAHAGEEIVVKLPTESNLEKIYVTETGNATNDYQKALFRIFLDDLDFFGKFERVGTTKEHEDLFTKSDLKEAFGHPKWESEKIAFVLKPEIDGNGLSAYLFSTKNRSLMHVKRLSLSGSISDDRRTIHKLADGIHKLIFGKDGITSSRILFAKQDEIKGEETPQWRSNIWQCDYDGANLTQLTNGEYAISPTFFPAKSGYKSSQYLYVSYRTGLQKIYLGNQKSPLITLRGNQLLPTISADQSKLAFISDASGRADLFIQNIDPFRGLQGKPIQVYSFPSSVQASPTFSPDGKKIAFVSDKEGTPRIYLVDTPIGFAGGKRPETVCLTTTHRENTCPSWSPDGRKLAYSAKVEGVRQIWVYDFDKNEEVAVTSGPLHKENPSWAPNSFHIIYNTCDNDESELYVMNLNEKSPRRISKGAGKKHYPSWER